MPRQPNQSVLSFVSEPEDYIGQGRSSTYSGPAVSLFTNTRNTVVVRVTHNHEYWTLEFAAPKHERLKVGTYKGAVRFGFQLDHQPGLSMRGCGRGCNRSFGEFTISAIRFTRRGRMSLLKMTFLQRNVGHHPESAYESLPALRGEVDYYRARA